MLFKDAANHCFNMNDVKDVEIKDSVIDVKVNPDADKHGLNELRSFNTDGFDVRGKNIYIHDVDIWNNDDCICVKALNKLGVKATCSENMLFENIRASGVGLTIGSVPASEHHNCVRNITFRNSYMPNTFKGIYVKSRPNLPIPENWTGEITDILYENITIVNPNNWGIWIGPQQAIYKDACRLTWPFLTDKCYSPPEVDFRNIVLRDVTMVNPKNSPGVIRGNVDLPNLHDITFDNVVIEQPGEAPFGADYYDCEGVDNGIYRRGTWPPPPCFSPAKTCDAEKFCVYGDFCQNSDCATCPAGYFCPDGNQKSLCPEGESSEPGAKSVEECFELPVTHTTEAAETTTTTASSNLQSHCFNMMFMFLITFSWKNL